MSRVAKKPLEIPQGVSWEQNQEKIQMKGPKGTTTLSIHPSVSLQHEGNVVTVGFKESYPEGHAMSGTTRALIANALQGVSVGFEKKLELRGVGYRAKISGKKLELTLGKSHLDYYEAPEGITITCPSQTEVVISGIDKQKIGQVSAEIRAFRPPEPYKGKGIRYVGEEIITKETKKK